MMLSLLLAAIAMPQDGCPVLPADYTQERYPQPLQASGKGLWIGGLAFGHDDVAAAEASIDDYGARIVNVRFSAQGRRKFLKAQRCGVGKMLEISIDGIVLSRPILNEQILGGNASLAGGWESQAEVDAAIASILPR